MSSLGAIVFTRVDGINAACDCGMNYFWGTTISIGVNTPWAFLYERTHIGVAQENSLEGRQPGLVVLWQYDYHWLQRRSFPTDNVTISHTKRILIPVTSHNNLNEKKGNSHINSQNWHISSLFGFVRNFRSNYILRYLYKI